MASEQHFKFCFQFDSDKKPAIEAKNIPLKSRSSELRCRAGLW